MPRTKTPLVSTKEQNLTLKQQLFVQKYIELRGNGTKAYMAVYGMKNEHTAAVKASDLVRNGYVLEYMRELTAENEKTSANRRAKIISHLEYLAFGGADKQSDQNKALEILAKIEGMMVEKVEHSLGGAVIYNVYHGVPRPITTVIDGNKVLATKQKDGE